MDAFGATSEPLAAVHDVALLDLDGVVYVGARAVPHAAEALHAARARHGLRAGFVTNNASRPPADVAGHLVELGIPARAADVVTSAQAGARVLAERLPHRSRVLAVGGPGVAWALEERGLVAVSSFDDGPAAVLQGYGPDVGWRQLAEASLAIDAGLPWVATNTDRTIPSPRGQVLGNGALVTALQHATGIDPVVAGKPEPPLMLESIERTGAAAPLMVGDRLDTDIEGATRSGIPSLLVLTGVTDWQDLLAAAPIHRPTYLDRDLRALLDPAPAVAVERTSGEVRARCRDAWARVRTAPMGGDDHPGDAWLSDALRSAGPHGGIDIDIDLARAVVALAWTVADSGARIHGQADVGRG